MINNMRHWADLSKTDPKFTKPFTRSGGFRGTDINPTWRIMRMTETFGPVGIGWGMTKPEYQTHSAGDETAVYCTVGIWFRDGEGRSDPVYGVGGDIIAKRGGDAKLRLDDEAYKKAYTDALGNAMKALGVSADVFLKLFDDSKYRDEVGSEYREKEKSGKPSKSEPATTNADALRKGITSAETLFDLSNYWREHWPQITALPPDVQADLTKVKDARKAELTKNETLMAG